MPEPSNYHIQISDRSGAIVIEGPDANWVAEQARWAVANRTDPKSPLGFSIESGGVTPSDRAETPDQFWLGQGGPKV